MHNLTTHEEPGLRRMLTIRPEFDMTACREGIEIAQFTDEEDRAMVVDIVSLSEETAEVLARVLLAEVAALRAGRLAARVAA